MDLIQIFMKYMNHHMKKIEIGNNLAKAYDKKAIELHGEFANLNFK